jgi:predicted RNase H-like nuclease (RuvC/YqgF family)
MFNPKMFKQKKKRAVDPNAPPRPNLLSQDKKLREQTEAVERLLRIVERQQDEIESLKSKYADMQQSVNQIVNYLRKGR